MNWTNKFTNSIGTITALLTVLSGFMASLGCVPGKADFEASCSISWLPPEYSVYAATGFGALLFVMKLLRPGGFLRNLFGGTAVITPVDQPGTVTLKQVGSA
jgi:ABC-type spermidine/putrescine transport system permease subunit II